MNYIKKYRFQIICSLFLIWAAVGVWPLSCYESDSMHIIAGGNNYIAGGGDLLPPNYSYEYNMQPLVTVLVVGLKYLFSFLSCEQIYCLLTAIAALFFAVGCFFFGNKVIGLNKEYMLLSLILIPETYACAYYPNSTTLAASLFIWGLLFLKETRWLLAGLLFCIAPLFRVDVVIVYPTIFALFIYQGYNWKKAMTISVIYALAVIIFVCLGCWLMKANPIESLASYNSMNNNLVFTPEVKFAVFTFYTALGVLLLPLGVVNIVKTKHYKLLFLCLLPILLLHYMFRNTGCATKHYLYLLPFVAIIYSIGLRVILNLKSNFLKYGICCGILFFLIFSIRIDFPDRPWRNEKKSEAHIGPFVLLAENRNSVYRPQFGIGAGQLIPTEDEFMLASGNLFYPFYIYSHKQRKESYRREAYELLKGKSYNLLLLSWSECSWFVNLLMEDGWIMRRNKHQHGDSFGKLIKDHRNIDCYFTLEIEKNDSAGLLRVLSRHRNDGTICIVAEVENINYLLEKAARQGKIKRLGERCYELN